jgi:hypothetical protein
MPEQLNAAVPPARQSVVNEIDLLSKDERLELLHLYCGVCGLKLWRSPTPCGCAAAIRKFLETADSDGWAVDGLSERELAVLNRFEDQLRGEG